MKDFQSLAIISLSAILFFIAAGSPVCSAANQNSLNWRQLGTAARMAADGKNYKAAIHGYILAIKKAEETEQPADVILNLKLCLAETFCSAGQLDDCERLLNSVKEKIFDGVSAKDLSIQVRYWRRVTNLELARKDKKAAAIASGNGMKVLSKISPDHNSNRYLGSWFAHMFLLSEQDDLQPMLNDLEDFAKNNSALIKRRSTARLRFMDACHLWFERAQNNRSVSVGDANLLKLTKYTDDEQALELWNIYLQNCHARQIPIDKNTILSFFATYRKVPDSAENCLLQIRSREAVRQYIETAKDLTEEDKIKFSTMLYDTFKADKDCSTEELNIKLCACANLLSTLCRSGASKEKRDALMTEYQALCKEIPMTKDGKHWTHFYMASRFWLIQFYVHDKKLNEMEETLSHFDLSVLDPKTTAADRQNFITFTARQHAYMGALFLEAGDMGRANIHFSQARRMLPLLSEKEKTFVLSMMVTPKSQADPKQNSNTISTKSKSKNK